jgi:hypothetical protein
MMNSAKPRNIAEMEKPAIEIEGNIRELVRRDTSAFRQTESESEMAANNLSTLLRRVSGNSAREIDNLIGELQVLRDKLQADSDRVEREIVEYASLSQSVIQLTKIIADGVTQVKKVPDAPSISG